MDVTEQEQLTKAFRKSEEELRQILDLTPQLVAVFGPQRERLYINRIALDYLGVTLDEWRDRRPGPEVHPDDAEQLRSRHSSRVTRSEEHTSELQSPCNLVCRLLLEKKKNDKDTK